MPNLTAQQGFVLQLEMLSPTIWDSTNREAVLSRILGTGGQKAEQVSLHAFRMDIQTDNPANFEANNTDGGTLPQGQGSKWNQFTFLPMTYCLPVGFTHQAQRLANPRDVSNIDPIAKTMADVVEQAAKTRDTQLQTPGDGSQGTVDSVAGLTITLRSTSTTTIDGRGAHLLSRNQRAQIQSSAYVPRGSFLIIDCFNFLGTTQSLVVDNVPGGTGAGDLVIMAGLPGGAPVGVNGIPVFNNTSTTSPATLLGLSRSLSYVVANGVNAGQSQVSVPMLMIAENQIKQRLGPKHLEGTFWHMHESQSQAYMELGWNLEYIPLNGGKADEFDPFFKNYKINGRKVFENTSADQTRADLLNKKSWCMVKWGAETPYWLKSKSGNMFFTGYDTASGLPTTNETAYQQESYQWGVGNPSSQGGYFSAKVPVGN